MSERAPEVIRPVQQDDPPLLSSRERKYIRFIQRRIAYLANRIASAEAKGVDLSFDKQELAALSWVIEMLSPLDAWQP